MGAFIMLKKEKNMGIIKRMLCKHDKTEYVSTDLVRQNDGSFITKHTWRCKNCGELIEGKKHGKVLRKSKVEKEKRTHSKT
uniref:Uncharacterized protein n=1 Tax=Siphoviridae sp. ctL4w2 TaxID=2827844 RepID=A0A8S5SYU0_9CAUD|nr:MAG TPA: hypothetical protein [Siphoviridae sp. ctL4w2]